MAPRKKRKHPRGKAGPAQEVAGSIWTAGVTPQLLSTLYRQGLPTPTARQDFRILGDNATGSPGGRLWGDNPTGSPAGKLWGDSRTGSPAGTLWGDHTTSSPAGPLFPPPPPQIMGHLFGDESMDEQLGPVYGAGYLPDVADRRDYTLSELAGTVDPESDLAKHVKAAGAKIPPKLPQKPADLRKHFGPVQHQGAVQSCTAHAVLAMAEFHLKRKGIDETGFSRLFLYKVARDLCGIPDDRGCTLRETLKVIRKWGCLPEPAWPYHFLSLERSPHVKDIDRASDSAIQGMNYCRLDDSSVGGPQTLENVLRALAAGFPVAFGFSLFSCLSKMKNDVIPVPAQDSQVTGGHAVLAVGYRLSSKEGGLRKGELLIRNSWGENWADRGYAWLPFEYVTEQLAYDFWVLYPDKDLGE